MTTEPAMLYSYADIERETGIKIGTLRVWYLRGKMPPADFRVGQSPAWLPATIRPWIKTQNSDNKTG